jgi:hypothetical protein
VVTAPAPVSVSLSEPTSVIASSEPPPAPPKRGWWGKRLLGN